MYDIDNILANSGFGESVSLGGKSSTKIEMDIEPDHQAYAECYAYALRDEVMMENEKLTMHIEVAKIRATGEDLKEMSGQIKDKVKEGQRKIKRILLALYDKVIRFFTETVRYFFSNEKKIGKTLATIKAALKKSPKDGEGTAQIVKVEELAKLDEEYGVSESYKGYGELSNEKDMKKGFETARKRQDDIQKQFEKGHINEDYVTEKVKYHEEKIASSRSKKLEVYHKSMKKYFSKLASTMKKENEEIKKKATSVLNDTNNGESSDGIRQEIKERLKTLSDSTLNSTKDLINTLTSENYTALDIALGCILLLKKSNDDETTIREKCEEFVNTQKDSIKEFKTIQERMNEIFNDKTSVSYKDGYEILSKALEYTSEFLDGKRSGGTSMKVVNRKIRGFVNAKRSLGEKINDNNDEKVGKELQKERITIIYCIKYMNAFKDKQEKEIGLNLYLAKKLLEDFAKVSK